MSLLSQIIALQDKHLALLDKYPKVGDRINITYSNLEIMKFMYANTIMKIRDGTLDYLPRVYEDYYKDDLLLSQGLDKNSLAIASDIKALKLSLNTQPLYAFITVGWNEQTVTPKNMLSASQNILNLKYFSTAQMVLEKHRENGIHHHTHFLVEFSEKFHISKLLGWIFQTRGVKAICLKQNFIDYLGPQNGKKPYQTFEVYSGYIRGIKKEAKLKYVALDKIWRAENKIEDIYIKE